MVIVAGIVTSVEVDGLGDGVVCGFVVGVVGCDFVGVSGCGFAGERDRSSEGDCGSCRLGCGGVFGGVSSGS